MYKKGKAANLAALTYLILIVYLNSSVPNVLSTSHVLVHHIAYKLPML